jgi:hypothetical protein
MDLCQLERRREDFMRGVVVVEQRRRLETFATNLRKQKRHEFQQKRRYNSPSAIKRSQTFSDALLDSFPQLDDPTEDYEAKLRLMSHLLTTPQYQVDALVALRKLTSQADDKAMHEPVLKLGFVTLLVGLLKRSSSLEVVTEAAGSLGNLAELTHACVDAIVEANAIPALMSVVTLQPVKPNEVILAALGNIAKDSVKHRDTLIRFGFIEMLCDFARQVPSLDPEALRSLAWCMGNISEGRPGIGLAYVRMLAEQAVSLLAKVRDKEVRTDVMFCLSHLADTGSRAVDELLRLDVSSMALMHLRKSKIKQRLQAVLRLVGNIATGTVAQSQRLLDDGLLDELKLFLSKGPLWALSDVMWSLSNIAAGSPEQSEELLKHPIMQDVHETLSYTDTKARKEASYIYKNIALKCCPAKLLDLASQGILLRLEQALRTPCAFALNVSSTQNLLVLIDKLLGAAAAITSGDKSSNFIADLMEETGVVRMIEALQRHSNTTVYALSSEILARYFEGVPVQEAELPVEAPSEFVFS